MAAESSLRPGAYAVGRKIFSVLCKPHVQRVLSYLEQNPGSTYDSIHENVIRMGNRSRVNQIILELKSIDLVDVTQPRVGRANVVFLKDQRLELINNTIARLL